MTMEGEGWRGHAEANANNLEQRLHNLEQMEQSVASQKKFWMRARYIAILFKSLRPLAEEKRESLWKLYRRICENAKRKEQHESTECVRASIQKRRLLEALIAAAHRLAAEAKQTHSLNIAGDILKQAMLFMKEGANGSAINHEIVAASHAMNAKLRREDFDVCWELWKQAKEVYDDRRPAIFSPVFFDFKRHALDALDAAQYGKPLLAKGEAEGLLSELERTSMFEEQVAEIRGILNVTLLKAEEGILVQKDEESKRQRQLCAEQRLDVGRLKGVIAGRKQMLAKVRKELKEEEERWKSWEWKAMPKDVRVSILVKQRSITELRSELKSMRRSLFKTQAEINRYLDTQKNKPSSPKNEQLRCNNSIREEPRRHL